MATNNLVGPLPILHGMLPTSGSSKNKKIKHKKEETKRELRLEEQVENVTKNQTKTKKLGGLRGENEKSNKKNKGI